MFLTNFLFSQSSGASLIALMLIGAVSSVIHSLYFSKYSHIPSPKLCKISRLWIVYLDVTLQRTAKVYEWHKQYGPVILIVPGEVSLSEPSTAREIYGATGRHPKSSYFDKFIALTYLEHREKRSYSASFFKHLQSIYLALLSLSVASFGPNYSTHTIELPGTERAMLDDLKYCEVLQPLLFNFPSIYYVFKFAASIIRQSPQFLTGEERLSEWTTKTNTDITADAPPSENQNSLREVLQNRTSKQGEPLPESWINAELFDNLIAASLTVTVSLTYVLWNMARNPEWQVRVRKEIAALPIQEDGLLLFDDIDKAPILEACIKESYRLNPISAGRAERIVPLGKEYNGVFLPNGTIVSASALAVQHSTSVFPEPHIYNPDRWLQASSDQLRNMEKYYMPFGYGARLCLVKAFATVEVKLLVACLLSRYSISVDPSSVTNIESMSQLGTQDGLPKGLRCDLKIQPVIPILNSD
ncbi:cytochrome P450 CYP625A1 [Xylogone sp. PMI_703]|nr:cytochrome P450 CYP625A1 [Xylogone sp. PMI_703]